MKCDVLVGQTSDPGDVDVGLSLEILIEQHSDGTCLMHRYGEAGDICKHLGAQW